jgi:hypothetical protein
VGKRYLIYCGLVTSSASRSHLFPIFLQTSLQFINTINFLELKPTSLPASVAD